MNRLDSFTMTLKTGPRGRDSLPRVCINDIGYELEHVEGGVDSGQTLTTTFEPHHNVQKFVLEGPDSGLWDVEDMRIEYQVRGRKPYSVHLGPVTLDRESDLNLWYDSPEDTFEV